MSAGVLRKGRNPSPRTGRLSPREERRTVPAGAGTGPRFEVAGRRRTPVHTSSRLAQGARKRKERRGRAGPVPPAGRAAGAFRAGGVSRRARRGTGRGWGPVAGAPGPEQDPILPGPDRMRPGTESDAAGLRMEGHGEGDGRSDRGDAGKGRKKPLRGRGKRRKKPLRDAGRKRDGLGRNGGCPPRTLGRTLSFVGGARPDQLGPVRTGSGLSGPVRPGSGEPGRVRARSGRFPWELIFVEFCFEVVSSRTDARERVSRATGAFPERLPRVPGGALASGSFRINAFVRRFPGGKLQGKPSSGRHPEELLRWGGPSGTYPEASLSGLSRISFRDFPSRGLCTGPFPGVWSRPRGAGCAALPFKSGAHAGRSHPIHTQPVTHRRGS